MLALTGRAPGVLASEPQTQADAFYAADQIFIRWAMKLPAANPERRRVFAAITAFGGITEEGALLSRQDLADLADLSPQGVKTAVRRLLADGHIERTQGPGRTCRYWVTQVARDACAGGAP